MYLKLRLTVFSYTYEVRFKILANTNILAASTATKVF